MSGWKKAGAKVFRSWWILSGIGGAVLACILGWPQWAVTYIVVKHYTSRPPVLKNVSWINPLRIERGRVAIDQATIAFQDLTLNYDLFSKTGRFFPEFSADAIRLTIGEKGSEGRNFEGRSAFNNRFEFLPVHSRLNIERIQLLTLNLAGLEAMFRSADPAVSSDLDESLLFGPLKVEVEMRSGLEWTSSVAAEGLHVSFHKGDQENTYPEGHVAVEVSRGPNTEGRNEISLHKFELQVPGRVDVAGSGSVILEEYPEMAMDLPVCRLGEIDFSRWIPDPFPVKAKMESLEASGSRFFIRPYGEKPMFSPTKATIHVKDLQLYNADAMYYKGDLLLGIEGSDQNGGSLLQTTLMFDKGKQANLRTTVVSDEIKSHLLITGLNGGDIAVLLPTQKTNLLSNKDIIHDIMVSSDVCLNKQSFDGFFKTQFTLQKSDNTKSPGMIQGDWHVAKSNLYNPYHYEVNAQIDSDIATADIEYSPNYPIIFHVIHISPPQVWAFYRDTDWIDKLSFDMKGDCSISHESKMVINNEHYSKWKADFTTSSIQYRGQQIFSGSTGVISGEGYVNVIRHNRIEKGSISGSLGTVGNVNLSNLSLSLNPFKGSGAVDGEVDLASIGQIGGMDPLRGRLHFHSGLTASQGILQGNLDTNLEGLGWKQYAFPYPFQVMTHGSLVYDVLKGKVQAHRIELTGGDGLGLSLDHPMYQLPLGIFSSQLTGQGNLQALVALGWAQSASGTVQASGNLQWEDQCLYGSVKMEMNTDMLRIKEPSLQIEKANLCVAVQRKKDIGYEGSGLLSISDIHFGGIRGKDLGGVLRFEGDKAILADESCALWGGIISGETRIDMSSLMFPVMFMIHASELDLDVLRSELDLNSFKIEGKINGDLAGTGSLSGMNSMTLTMNAPNGILLDQKLVTQLLSARMGSTRIVEKMVKKALGSEPMIPFEKATLNLHYENTQYTGTIQLDGAKLAMSIDVTIEPRVLYGLFGWRTERSSS